MARQRQNIFQINQIIIAFSCLLLISAPPSITALEKWSRQIEATGPGPADSFADWVPLAQPVDGTSKEREARVLTYSQSFPPNGRFGELQKPQHQQTFDFPFQLQRFGPNGPQQHQHQPQQQQQQLRQQSGSIASALKSQEPTSQSFFKFEMPFRGDGNNRQAGAPPTLQTGYQIQHSFGGGAQATLFNSPFYSQQPVFPPEFHPIPQKPMQQSLHKQKPLHHQNFIEDTLPLKSAYRESKPLQHQQQQQQALQSVTPQVFPVDPQPETAFELNKPTTFQSQPPAYQPVNQVQNAAPSDPAQQEVQLLYVPYDTLYNQQQPQGPTAASNSPFEVNKLNLNSGLPAVNPYQINQFYTQDPLAPQDPNFYATSTTSRPLTSSLKPNSIFQDFLLPQTTTPKPKPKAHQPPLAMFLIRNSARPTQSDVVGTLRNAHTIAVIDAPTKTIPEIFVGPAGMPIPDGYVKFDLPYLSQLTHSRDLADVPFFVAPLSYRTPNGFHKILLPEPHVGSIVINRAKYNSVVANTVTYAQNNEVNQYQTNAPPRTRPTQHRVRPTTIPKDFYQEITTQRATLQPTRGNKFNYFYDQDQAIHEVTSPKVGKHDRPKKKRPQTVTIEQPNFGAPVGGPYKDFRPTQNQLENENFFKLRTNKPTTSSSTSTSTTSTSTSTTTSTTSAPTTLFTYKTSPQVEFQSTIGQLYHDLNAVKTQSEEQEYAPRFTTRPPPSTNADDEYQMKQYFRQQDAFRNRPHLVHTTNSPYEQVQYTPVQFDYDRELNQPTTTDKTTTTTKHRVTYYTPAGTPATPAADTLNTLPPHENVGEYGSQQPEVQSHKTVPLNHRPSYNQNEILDGTVEYEPNPYQLPSELPPLAPNLPGLVNNLQDKSKLRPNSQADSTTTSTTLSEPEPPTRPSRRPLNRIRKPVVTKVTSSVSYSESETSTRKPARPERVRRPYGTRGSANADTDSDDSGNDGRSSTTRRPSSARNPLIRNPNRIRYQPTNEERQSLRSKNRKHGSKKGGGADEDIDYQRDVLKQNYPVFKGRKPTSPTAIPSSYAVTTTEGTTSETQQVYTVTPSNNIEQTNEQTFPAGLLEPMQIAQQYNDFSKDNYGPGYFPNQEDLNPTEPVYKNEVSPVFTTLPSTAATPTQRPRYTPTTTTSTEEPTATTRRSPFIRRNYPRPRLTTTEAPTTTTTTAPEERSTTRSRIPPRKVIKVRTRTRRPLHPASSTNTPEEEAAPQEDKETKSNYRKLNRFNADLYENDASRRRNKHKFRLEGQESQWSPAVKSQNHFQPLSPKEASPNGEAHKLEEEPEIVTADPDANNEPLKKSDTYEVNVSANFGSADNNLKTTIQAPNLKPEKSFAELLEEVMGKAPEEQPLNTETETRTTDGSFFESQKTTPGDRFNRRGKWKKSRTSTTARVNESFETAESQNLGAQLFNSLNAAIQADKTAANDEHKIFKSSTTPMGPAIDVTNEPKLLITTTPTPQTTVDGDYQLTTTTTPLPLTTPKQMELLTTLAPSSSQDNDMLLMSNTTPPQTTEPAEQAVADDLETQPSLFSEVKKQLHELFSIDDNEDDRAVTAALAAVGRRRQEYTSIKRERPPSTTTLEPNLMESATTTIANSDAPTTTATADSKKAFHKNLMEHVVYATSTSTKVTSETEICYRGRCVRSEDLPANHKLN